MTDDVHKLEFYKREFALSLGDGMALVFDNSRLQQVLEFLAGKPAEIDETPCLTHPDVPRRATLRSFCPACAKDRRYEQIQRKIGAVHE